MENTYNGGNRTVCSIVPSVKTQFLLPSHKFKPRQSFPHPFRHPLDNAWRWWPPVHAATIEPICCLCTYFRFRSMLPSLRCRKELCSSDCRMNCIRYAAVVGSMQNGLAHALARLLDKLSLPMLWKVACVLQQLFGKQACRAAAEG